MRLNDIFTAPSIAYRLESEYSNQLAFAGEAFFPAKKKLGVDLKWIKARKGLGVALKASTYDSMSTIRSRGGISVLAEEMPLFRESMAVSERDLAEIRRAQESNDPYLLEVLDHLYSDVAELVDGANISAERMRMQLICPTGGEVKISIADGSAIYTYDYDSDGSWKKNHYMELTGTDTWDKPTSAKPLSDIYEATSYLRSEGFAPQYIMMNTKTFNYLLENDQMKNALITTTGAVFGYLDAATGKDVLQRKSGLQVILYDKKYAENDANKTQKNFFPDGYVTIIGAGALGNTWYGVTPEEGSLMDGSNVDVALYGNGIAIATKVDYGPPYVFTTTASQIVLPSYEGMDSTYTIKVTE